MKRRKLMKWFIWIFFLFGLLLLNGCQRQEGGFTIAGSTSVQPFAEMLSEEYMGQHGQEKIFIQGGGSSAGIQAVRTEAAQVGMSSRNLTPSEQDLIAFPIAYDAIVIIVHPKNPIRNLTREQIRGVFSGKVRNWSEIGGRSHPITLVSREEGSGTREAFHHLIMGKEEISLRALVQDSNGAIRQVIADDPNAIGYISLGLVNDRVIALQIDGVEPNVENIKNKRYQFVRPFLFIFKHEPQGSGKNFLNYTLSPEGQNILVHEGLVSVVSISAPPTGILK
jgi:phosphate transport system substrate-binding protein